MANYIVTGAAGFIASRISEFLLNAGHTVIGIDNLNDDYDIRLKEYRLRALIALQGFTFAKVDISCRGDVEKLHDGIEKVDAVINLAAQAGVRSSVKNPWAFYETNVLGSLNMLDLCRRRGIPKFVLASSSSVYGENAPQPTPEETDSNHPIQPYAASKKAAETLAYSYHFLHGIDVTIFRYFTVYGPAGRPDMAMFRFCQWIAENRPINIFGDGNQTRGFTYLDDIARGTILGLEPLGFEIINLGGHEVISINDLVKLFEKKLRCQARIINAQRNLADMNANWANIDKARRILGWEPYVSLSDGISNIIDWYFAERGWASEIYTG